MRFKYSCFATRHDGTKVWLKDQIIGDFGPFHVGHRLIVTREDMLEVINGWNAQALHQKENFPRYVYYLHPREF